MDLRFTPEEEAFRLMVRDWMRENVPPALARKVIDGLRVTKDEQVDWQRRLNDRGWLAPAWPKDHGGTGWSAIEQHIFDEEMALAGGPPPLSFAVHMIGPVLIAFGTPAQKEKWLPRILRSDDWWCQGFSEPGSGSDLASLRTKAEPADGGWVINGQKTWTTLAQHADMIFVLARTEPDAPKPQEGISFFLVDMKSPGVTVRPIITIDGEHEVNEVWFDDVKVPAENLVGERGKGWTIAKYLLSHERTNIAGVGRSKRQLARLKRIAAAELMNGRPLTEDPRFAVKIAEVEMELMALEMTVLRVASAAGKGERSGAAASMLKIKGTEIQQAITELLVQAAGPYAQPFVPEALDDGWNEEPIGPAHAAPLAPAYFNWRKVSIYGGSNEIQRNIIAKAVLGL